MSDIISKFMTRVKTASQGRSKDIRLSIDEANELMAAIGELMAAKISLLKTEDKAPDVVEIKVDGGRI